MRRRALTAACVVLLGGCGDDASTNRSEETRRAADGPFLFGLGGLREEFRRAGLRLERVAPSRLASSALPRPRRITAFQTKSGTRLDVLLFPTASNAAEAAQPLRRQAERQVLTATNVVVLLERSGGSARRVQDVMRTLGQRAAGPEPRDPGSAG